MDIESDIITELWKGKICCKFCLAEEDLAVYRGEADENRSALYSLQSKR